MGVPMDPSDTGALKLAARRFVWMTLFLYAGLTVGLWGAHAAFPLDFGGVTDRTISVSGIAAVAFAGMYAAALALRQGPSKRTAAAAAGDVTTVRENPEERSRPGKSRKAAKPDEGRLRSEQVWAELRDLENTR